MFKRFYTSNSYVPESSFIGRRTLLNRLQRELCVDSDARVSYCGLLKIGKTSLMRRFEEQVNRGRIERDGCRCVVAYYALYTLAARESLFKCLTERIGKTIFEQRIDCPEEVLRLEREVAEADDSREQIRRMSRYVAALHENGIRIILILDELQSLPENEGLSFADFAMLHEMRDISIAYVGRFPFDKTMNDLSPSVWSSRLTCKQGVVLGFDEEDMEEYRSVFYNLYGYDITWMLDDLERYCGRSPFLLACFGEEIMFKLADGDPLSIDHKWLAEIYASYHPTTYERNVQEQLALDVYEDRTNLDRLQRIVIGPQIGIHEWDMTLMKQLGYITFTNSARYAISPSFENRLRCLPISGELPTKLVTAETYLRKLIHKKIFEISAEHPFSEPVETVTEIGKYQWSAEERTILNLELMRIPNKVTEKRRLDSTYRLYDAARGENKDAEKYALWVLNKKATLPMADIEEVMLLHDRLGLINGCWKYFADYFEGGDRRAWRENFYLMCVARNPALHAGTLTREEQIDCERACDAIIRSLGGLWLSEEEKN